MPSYKVRMRDGTVKEFPHKGRAGGSWTKTIKYEPGFVVITNEYHQRTSIPTDLIEEIIETPERW